MAKKQYHIPINDTQIFIKNNLTEIKKIISNKTQLEYSKIFGKAHYDTYLEKSINFFKIDKDTKQALSQINYFNSNPFFTIVADVFHFEQFELEKNNITNKEFFYALSHLVYKKDKELFNRMVQKLFIHYHNSNTSKSDINIDYKDMVISLAKIKKLSVKESFGERENAAYFKILIQNKEYVSLEGKSIKTLRKKAYKQMCNIILDLEDTTTTVHQDAYDSFRNLSFK
jgi:hypothetical protein